MQQQLDTLVRDIYNLMEGKTIPEGVNLEEECERFGQKMATALLDSFTEYDGRGRLRLSAIGKHDRQIYNSYNGVASQPIRGSTYIKFLYGHLVEAMLVALTRISGHEVTDEQKQLEVGGVKGHMDCRIDGVVVDVKSCSSYGFKKFRNHKLHEDDPFGYIGQLKAYAHAEGESEYAWLAMDKANGSLCVLRYDERDTTTDYYDSINWDVGERIEAIKKLIGGSAPPQICYEPIEDGKSGNMKLDTGCTYCDFRYSCWPNVQVYHYSSGPRYLTTVVREPNVLTIPKEF